MKKAMVLHGKQGTGKSWIKHGILEIFDKRKLTIRFSEIDFNINESINNHKINLVVFEECPTIELIEATEYLRKQNPDTSFVYCTQEDVSALNPEKYHIVECTWDPNRNTNNIQAVPLQLCPKCNGLGEITVQNWLSGSPTGLHIGTTACDVCNGGKVIPMHVLDS